MAAQRLLDASQMSPAVAVQAPREAPQTQGPALRVAPSSYAHTGAVKVHTHSFDGEQLLVESVNELKFRLSPLE